MTIAGWSRTLTRLSSIQPLTDRRLAQAAGGCMPVHPGTAAVEQDRPAIPGAYCPVDSAPDGWRQRDQDHLGALAAHTGDPVTVFLANMVDVGAGGFEY